MLWCGRGFSSLLAHSSRQQYLQEGTRRNPRSAGPPPSKDCPSAAASQPLAPQSWGFLSDPFSLCYLHLKIPVPPMLKSCSGHSRAPPHKIFSIPAPRASPSAFSRDRAAARLLWGAGFGMDSAGLLHLQAVLGRSSSDVLTWKKALGSVAESREVCGV